MYFKDFSIYLLVLPLFIGRVFLKARIIVLISDLFCLTFVCWCWCYIVIIFGNRCPFRHCILLAWFWVCFKNVTIRTSVTVQIEEVIVWIYGVIVWIEGVTVHIWVVINMLEDSYYRSEESLYILKKPESRLLVSRKGSWGLWC